MILDSDALSFAHMPGYALLVAASLWGAAQIAKVLKNGQTPPETNGKKTNGSAGAQDPAYWKLEFRAAVKDELDRRNAFLKDLIKEAVDDGMRARGLGDPRGYGRHGD